MVHNITNHNNMNHSSFYGNLCPGLLPVHTCVAELNELNSPMPEEGGGRTLVLVIIILAKTDIN